MVATGATGADGMLSVNSGGSWHGGYQATLGIDQ
jgi:hypothetical protein